MILTRYVKLCFYSNFQPEIIISNCICILLSGHCNGVKYDRECCSAAAPCAINEGDCDSDSECQGDLTCGSNNCPAPFPSDADCCSSSGKETL